MQKSYTAKTILLLSFLLFNTFLLKGQSKTEILTPQSFFPKERSKVLFVGSFHFDYPGLDAHIIAKDDRIDVLSEAKKLEVTELVNYIKKFKPTKIAIEALPQWKATDKLKEYKHGGHRMERDERYQLGFRIANELKLDTIYAIDDDSMVSDLENFNPEYFKNLFKDYDYKSEDPYNKDYEKWYSYEDKLKSRMNLLAYFKLTNSRSFHEVGHGAYLVGDFKLDNKRGADALAINWYSRNLRIFRKLQEITQGPEDRILVIFGNGHGSILRQLLESSPEYKFVEFDSLK